ncbi:recombinase family protein [Microbacterium lacus]|uniref:recombinase family protein n=1 Tax=Microbacterium lacus TaxID=415217 RepID=UPI00384AE4A0
MTTIQPKRAAIYARISEKVAHKDKVADQVADCKRFAAARGYVVDDRHIFIDDGISALGGKARPGFVELAGAAAAGEFSVIVATEEERIARNVPEKIELHTVAIEAGIVWDTIRDGFTDPATEAGEFFSTMRAAMGRMESRRKASRQRSANLDRASRGEPNPGRRRYGYELDGRTPREPEAAVVRRIFEHIAGGGSVRSIAIALTDEGVDPGTAKAWRPLRIREIANNPHYAGAMRHLGAVIPSAHIIPIVDAELAEEVRAILADPSRVTTTGQAPKHLASLIATCATCGARMVYMRGYVCSAGAKSGHAQIAADKIEPRIRAEVALAFVTSGHKLMPADERRSIAALVERLQRNETAATHTAADRDEGLLSTGAARARLVELRDERLAIETELDRVKASAGALAPLSAVARELMPDEEGGVPMADVWAARDRVLERFEALDLDRQRDAVRAFLEVEVVPFYKHDAEGRRVAQGGDRLRVWHKIATELNPNPADYIVDSLDVGDGDSHPATVAAARARASRASS